MIEPFIILPVINGKKTAYFVDNVPLSNGSMYFHLSYADGVYVFQRSDYTGEADGSRELEWEWELVEGEIADPAKQQEILRALEEELKERLG